MNHRRLAVVLLWLGLAVGGGALAGCAKNPGQDTATPTNGTSTTNAPADPSDPRAVDAQSEEQWAYSVGVQKYVFGLPSPIAAD